MVDNLAKVTHIEDNMVKRISMEELVKLPPISNNMVKVSSIENNLDKWRP